MLTQQTHPFPVINRIQMRKLWLTKKPSWFKQLGLFFNIYGAVVAAVVAAAAVPVVVLVKEM